METLKNFLNKNCFWSHDFPQWGDPFDRGWKHYGEDAVYTRTYQRRTCGRCGVVSEQQIESVLR